MRTEMKLVNTTNYKINNDLELITLIKSIGSVQKGLKTKNKISELIEIYNEVIEDADEGEEYPLNEKVISILKKFKTKSNFIWMDTEIGISDESEVESLNDPKIRKFISDSKSLSIFIKLKWFDDLISLLENYLIKDKDPILEAADTSEQYGGSGGINQLYLVTIEGIDILIHKDPSVTRIYCDTPMELLKQKYESEMSHAGKVLAKFESSSKFECHKGDEIEFAVGEEKMTGEMITDKVKSGFLVKSDKKVRDEPISEDKMEELNSTYNVNYSQDDYDKIIERGDNTILGFKPKK